MKQYKTTLFLNGDEIAFVMVPVSQKDRFETLVRQLSSYAKRFGNDVTYSTDIMEEQVFYQTKFSEIFKKFKVKEV